MSVKGAEGAAQPFTLDGQAVFCYCPLFRHPVGIVHSQLDVDEGPVLTTAGPFYRDVQHDQIQHFQQAVRPWESSLGLENLHSGAPILHQFGGLHKVLESLQAGHRCVHTQCLLMAPPPSLENQSVALWL